MGWRSWLAKPYAWWTARQVDRWSREAWTCQEAVLKTLIAKGRQTAFGKTHHFDDIRDHRDFKAAVPVVDYEQFKPYIDRIIQGERDVVWPGRPIYFAKTSGTTSGVKYIPVSRDSISNHIGTARTALLLYIAETGKADFADGKMMFLSGSPRLDKLGGIPTGRLSGIVNHHVPGYLRTNQVPSFDTNCIEDWETKLDRIVKETLPQRMTLISGIPPWVQMYFDRLMEKTGKKIKDVFPDFSVFVHGGVNFEPYRQQLIESIGREIDTIETYPASEGFLAFQDSQREQGLLLNINSGIFFEFIPADHYFDKNPPRLSLREVKTGVNYALIINNNAGLWGYSIGDTVQFLETDPYRITVTGRIKHYISAFGEHVIGKEVENALLEAAAGEGVNIIEFTVAPKIQVPEGVPYHEWFIEFDHFPDDLRAFAQKVDKKMQAQNIYYADLIKGGILQTLKIRPLQPDAFRHYMRSQGKLGGQNKVPRLANDRTIADALQQYVLEKEQVK